MSEESPPVESSDAPSPASKISPNLRFGILAFGALILLAIVWTTGTIRANNATDQGLKDMSSIVSVTVREPILKGEAGRLRLIATDIASAGNYASVSFTDKSGNVIASTDRLLQSKTLNHLEKPPLKPEIKNLEGHKTVFRAITLGQDNVIGGISIQLKP